MSPPRLYTDLADWWPLLSAPGEYAEEAAVYAGLLSETAGRPIASVLELGCGGGNNASHLKHRFERLVLTDISPHMLEVSRRLNPECEHHPGDMRTLRLDEQFDAVFVHDAVCYMTSEADLGQVIATAAAHCRVGGAVLFAPDYVRETFQAGTSHGGHDESGANESELGRGLRYVEWVWDPDPDDHQYRVDYAYLLRERDGTIQTVHDSHREGLFSRRQWQHVLRQAGFEVRRVPLILSDVEPGRHEMFVGRKRASA